MSQICGSQRIASQRISHGQGAISAFLLRPKKFIAPLIVAFVVVFVFEETIYGRLGVNGLSYLIAKTSTEAFLYFSLLIVFLHQLHKGALVRYRPSFFDYCLVTFLLVATFSTVMNHGSSVLGMLNIRTMLRYVAVYYIIVLSGWVPNERQLIRLIKLLVLIALLQAFLITLQHIAGDAFRDAYFSPPQEKAEVAGLATLLGAMENKLGAGFGTFGKTPIAAFFLLFVSVITVAMALLEPGKDARKWWFAYLVMLVGIYFTYKRAPLLLALTVPVLIAWLLGRKRLVRRFMALGLIAIPLLFFVVMMFKPAEYVKEKKVELSPVESIAQLFSEEYWEVSSSKARGWMIMEVGRQALVSFKPIGYGADEEHAKETLSKLGGEFGKLAGWGAFDDVYIVAALVYYGPVGVILLLLAFHYLYLKGRKMHDVSPTPTHRVFGISLSALTVLVFLSVFVVRLLEFRIFAFLFWAFAGIVIVATREHRIKLRALIKANRGHCVPS